MNTFTTKTPPSGFYDFKNVPLVHIICEFYKNIYVYSSKISKRDRFGIYLKIENICLEIMDLIIESALESRPNKLPLLLMARIKIEKLKRFFRMMYELNIIDIKKYLEFEKNLQEISRMTNSWIAYLKNSSTSKKQQLFENPAID